MSGSNIFRIPGVGFPHIKYNKISTFSDKKNLNRAYWRFWELVLKWDFNKESKTAKTELKEVQNPSETEKEATF